MNVGNSYYLFFKVYLTIYLKNGLNVIYDDLSIILYIAQKRRHYVDQLPATIVYSFRNNTIQIITNIRNAIIPAQIQIQCLQFHKYKSLLNNALYNLPLFYLIFYSDCLSLRLDNIFFILFSLLDFVVNKNQWFCLLYTYIHSMFMCLSDQKISGRLTRIFLIFRKEEETTLVFLDYDVQSPSPS